MQSQAAPTTYDQSLETFKFSVKANASTVSLSSLFNMLSKLKAKYPRLKKTDGEPEANYKQRKKNQQALYHLDLRELLSLVSTAQNGTFLGLSVTWRAFKNPPVLPRLITNMGHLLTILCSIKVSERGYAAKEHLVHGVSNLTLENSLVHLGQAAMDKKLSHPIIIIFRDILNDQAKQALVKVLNQSRTKGVEFPASILKEILGFDPVAEAAKDVSKATSSVRPATPPNEELSGSAEKADSNTPIATPRRRPEEEEPTGKKSVSSFDADDGIAYAAQYEDGSDTEEELQAEVKSPGLDRSLDVPPSQDDKLAQLFGLINASGMVISAGPLINALPDLDSAQANHLLDEVMEVICNDGKTVDDNELFKHFNLPSSTREGGGYVLNVGQRTVLMAQAAPAQFAPDSLIHAQQLVAMHNTILSAVDKNIIIDKLVELSVAQALPSVLLVLCINNWREDIKVAPPVTFDQGDQSLTLTENALSTYAVAISQPVNRKIDFANDAAPENHSLINFLFRVVEAIEPMHWDIELLSKIYATVPKQEHQLLTETIRDYHGFAVLGDKIPARNARPDQDAGDGTLQFVEPSSSIACTVVSDSSSARQAPSVLLSGNYNLDAEPAEYYFSQEQCIEVLSHQASFIWLSPLMQQDFLRSLAKHYAIFTDIGLEGGETKGLIQYNRLIAQLQYMDSYDLRIKVLTAFVNPSLKTNPNVTHPLAFREVQCWMSSVQEYISPDLAKISAQVQGEHKGESLLVLEPLIDEAQNDAIAASKADAIAAQITAITTMCYQCTIHIPFYEFPIFVQGYFTESKTPVIPQQYQGLVLLHMADRIKIIEGQLEAGSEAARFWQRTQQHVTRFTNVLPYLAGAIQIAGEYVEEKDGQYKSKDEKNIKERITAQLVGLATSITNKAKAEGKKAKVPTIIANNESRVALTSDIWDLIRYYKIIKKGQASGQPLSEIIPKLLDNQASEAKAKVASMLSRFRSVSSPVKGVQQKLTNKDIDDQQSLAVVMNDLMHQLTRPEFDESGHKKEVDPKFVFKALLLSAHFYHGTDHAFTPFDAAVPAPGEENDYFEAATAHGGSTIGGGSAWGGQHRAATVKKSSVAGSSIHGDNRQRATTTAEPATKRGDSKPPSNYGGSQSSSRMFQSDSRAATAKVKKTVTKNQV